MADEVLTSTELTKLLNEFLEELDSNVLPKTALLSLQKTFHTHNITIQDWNMLLEYVHYNLSNIAKMSKILEELGKHSLLDITKLENLENDVSQLQTDYHTVLEQLQVLNIKVTDLGEGVKVDIPKWDSYDFNTEEVQNE